jgi:hypothetical protein
MNGSELGRGLQSTIVAATQHGAGMDCTFMQRDLHESPVA